LKNVFVPNRKQNSNLNTSWSKKRYTVPCYLFNNSVKNTVVEIVVWRFWTTVYIMLAVTSRSPAVKSICCR